MHIPIEITKYDYQYLLDKWIDTLAELDVTKFSSSSNWYDHIITNKMNNIKITKRIWSSKPDRIDYMIEIPY